LAFLLAVCPAVGQTETPPAEESDPAGSPEAASTETTTVEETRSEPGAFWIFPEPAPLVGKIATDRPGFSDSAGLVPRGRTHIEGGYQFTYDREGKKRIYDHTLPQAALRTGLLDNLEFRANWSGYSFTETLNEVTGWSGLRYNETEHDDGATDFSLGLKTPLLKHSDDNCLPNVSLIGTVSFPTAGHPKSANDVVPELKLPWNYPITDEFTVYGSILGRIQHSDKHFPQGAATLAAAYSVTEWMKVYVEYFGVYHASDDEDCSHLISGGPIFAITDNISIDTRVSAGLNEQAPDFQASVGMGIRF
jgi:hypothetical protein